LAHWSVVDGQPLSAADLLRLRSRSTRSATVPPLPLRRDGGRRDLLKTIRWALIGLRTEASRWQAALPFLVRGEFVFSLALWAAVFSVTAAIVGSGGVPITARYGCGLASVSYLYLYVALARRSRPMPGQRVLLTVADAAILIILGRLSAPFAGYAHLLVFFTAARIAVRFVDLRALPFGLMLLIPFDIAQPAPPLNLVLDAFGVLTLMLVLQQLQLASRSARLQLDRQLVLSGLVSALARARDEETLFSQVVSLAAPLIPGSAWVLWLRDAGADEFRSVRWSGLPAGQRPVVNFTPQLASERGQPLLINGPLPGTATGEATLIQPVAVEGELAALLTVGAAKDAFAEPAIGLLRSLSEEVGVALGRLQDIDEQRNRRLAMEQANRIAALAAGQATDHAAALEALMPELAAGLRLNSVHLEWVDGDQLEIVFGSSDPLAAYAPSRLPLAGTRSAEALLQGRTLREPITGRRPEDLFCVPAGLRHAAVVPMRCAGVDGTLQVGRRDSRAFTAGETLLVELLAERLSLLFAGGVAVTPGAGRSPQEASR